MKLLSIAAVGACLLAGQAMAAPPPKPTLIVAISVDQFSADLFAEYRGLYTEGLKRLQLGAVFPSGYQSHAATETCPGHSTILTGSRPARTGIIANNWYDLGAQRADKLMYCSENPLVPGSTSSEYVVSDQYLKVPTLGDRMKAANPASRSVAVAGKDRAAVMMGGHDTDQMWWWGGNKGFVTLANRTGAPPPAVTAFNARMTAAVAKERKAVLPAVCASRAVSVPLTRFERSVGLLTDRKAGDFGAVRLGPEFDEFTADLAIDMIREMKLGKGAATDVIAIGLSATDYVGHRFGTEGGEMCAQMIGLDATIGRILAALDANGAPYAVVLTADHGGHDIAERHMNRGFPEAQRRDPAFTLDAVDAALKAEFGLPGKVLYGDSVLGDMYLSRDIPTALRPRVTAAAKAKFLSYPDVEAVFTWEELRRLPTPRPPVDEWSLAQRFKASFDPDRSGDLVVALRENINPIAIPSASSAATHGSPWGYDRRVPIVFYWPNATGFEQPLSIETVDIMPTLAALAGLAVPAEQIDGRCLDLDAGAATTCPRP